MKITIETSNWLELEKLLVLLNNLKIKTFNLVDKENHNAPTITKGDKNIDPTALFGIWKNRPRTLEHIRNKAWERK